MTQSLTTTHALATNAGDDDQLFCCVITEGKMSLELKLKSASELGIGVRLSAEEVKELAGLRAERDAALLAVETANARMSEALAALARLESKIDRLFPDAA